MIIDLFIRKDNHLQQSKFVNIMSSIDCVSNIHLQYLSYGIVFIAFKIASVSK